MRLFIPLLFTLSGFSQSLSFTSEHIPWGGYWWSMEYAEVVKGWNDSKGRKKFTTTQIKSFDRCLADFSTKCTQKLEKMAQNKAKALSPLMKFDYYVRKKLGAGNHESLFSHSSKREIDIHYIGRDKSHPLYENKGFAGKCIGWALSTMYYNEPIKTKVIEGISFTPGDIKALLAVKYNAAQLFITDNFLGNTYLDSTAARLKEKYFKDVSPQQLIKALEMSVKKGRVLEADLDPGHGVWNYPIFKYDFNWKQEGNKVSGKIKIYYMNDEVEKEAVFSKGQPSIAKRKDALTKNYTFKLKVKGKFKGVAKQINSSEWTSDSIEDHPDTLALGLEKNWEDEIQYYDDSDNTEFNFEVFKEDFFKELIREYDPKLKVSH